MNYDLHMHSYYSDGELSPTALMELVKDKGVSVCSLTDHDTLNGLGEAQQAAEKLGIEFICGVELSAIWRGQLIHIVGLNIDHDNDHLNNGIEYIKQKRQQRADKMFSKFTKLDIDLKEQVMQQLPENGIATRPHFAQALVDLGKAKDRQQAFQRYLLRGKKGYVQAEWPKMEQAAKWIIAANGVAVLAHPLIYKMTRTKLKILLDELSENSVKGIEVSTARTDQQQIDFAARLATEHNMYASIGSDFHTFKHPWAMVGRAKPLPDTVKPIWHLF